MEEIRSKYWAFYLSYVVLREIREPLNHVKGRERERKRKKKGVRETPPVLDPASDLPMGAFSEESPQRFIRATIY